MTSTHKLTFFDLEGKTRPWSPNCWKTRFLLNYKRIPYQTEWVRYENVKALNKKLGTGPTHDSPPFYTLPLILDERPGAEPKAVVDSVKIAEYIEGLYPDRPLATAALIAEQKPHYDAILTNVALPMFPIVVPAAVNNFDGPTAEYYTRTRPQIFGEEEVKLWKSEEHQIELWKKFEASLNTMATYIIDLRHGENSLFSINAEPIWVDFYLAVFFVWMKKAGPIGSWEKVQGWNDGLWERAYRNCEPYMQSE